METVGRLLVTGGAGFIGSHVCLELLQAGWAITVFDNFSTSRPAVLERLRQLAGCPPEALQLVEGDVCSPADLQRAFARAPVQAVLHLAGLKSVAESLRQPQLYEAVNVEGSRLLLEAMERADCRRLVFSSSAAVYGATPPQPVAENAPLRPLNPYGATKVAVEALLRRRVAEALPHAPWRVIALRYFNAVGGHPSGRLGEDPSGEPCNLFPLLRRVLAGRQPRLTLHGSDWPTPDGSAIRDYIHVLDLAAGHRAALRWVLAEPEGWLPLNLGSGQGHSVLAVIAAFEQAAERPLPWRAGPRREGDAACCVADPSRAELRLGWRARQGLAAMARDALAFPLQTADSVPPS